MLEFLFPFITCSKLFSIGRSIENWIKIMEKTTQVINELLPIITYKIMLLNVKVCKSRGHYIIYFVFHLG